jgi:hypothetical protein
MQIWWDVDENKDPSGDLSLMSSRSSNWSQRSERPTSIALIQSSSTLLQKYEGQPVLVVQKSRPPLLVAFLKDKGCGEAYTTLKTDRKSVLSCRAVHELANETSNDRQKVDQGI